MGIAFYICCFAPLVSQELLSPPIRECNCKKNKNSPETWCFFGGKKGDTSLVDSAENELCIQTSASGTEWSRQEEDGYPAKAKIQ
jgi:hypothetical protein